MFGHTFDRRHGVVTVSRRAKRNQNNLTKSQSVYSHSGAAKNTDMKNFGM